MGYLFDPDNWAWLFSGNNFLFLLRGFWINIQIALVAMVLSLTIGLGLALLRVSSRRVVSVVAGLWVDVWRNLPLIFTILYFFLVMPESWRDAYERWVPGWFPTAFQTPFFLAAILGLTFYMRRRIGTRRWRNAHRLTPLVYVLGVTHTLGAGTDAGEPWLIALVLATGTPILYLGVLRTCRIGINAVPGAS